MHLAHRAEGKCTWKLGEFIQKRSPDEAVGGIEGRH